MPSYLWLHQYFFIFICKKKNCWCFLPLTFHCNMTSKSDQVIIECGLVTALLFFNKPTRGIMESRSLFGFNSEKRNLISQWYIRRRPPSSKRVETEERLPKRSFPSHRAESWARVCQELTLWKTLGLPEAGVLSTPFKPSTSKQNLVNSALSLRLWADISPMNVPSPAQERCYRSAYRQPHGRRLMLRTDVEHLQVSLLQRSDLWLFNILIIIYNIYNYCIY